MRDTATFLRDLGPRLIEEGHEVDPAIVRALPKNGKIVSAHEIMTSAWFRTAKIEMAMQDGSTQAYFVKSREGPLGLGVMEGHYESYLIWSAVAPEMIPKAIDYGTLDLTPDVHFFIQEFKNLENPGDKMVAAIQKFAHLQIKSIGMRNTLIPQDLASNLKFGFHVATPIGDIPQSFDWTETWEACFTNYLQGLMDREQNTYGPREPEVEQLLQKVVHKIIPRVLRPMEVKGRQLEPCLLMTDMNLFNTATDAVTGEILFVDVGAAWGHNEMDLRQLYGETSPLGTPWSQVYLEAFGGPTAPAQDFEIRQKLYRLITPLVLSLLQQDTRDMLATRVQILVDAVPDTFEDWLLAENDQE